MSGFRDDLLFRSREFLFSMHLSLELSGTKGVVFFEADLFSNTCRGCPLVIQIQGHDIRNTAVCKSK